MPPALAIILNVFTIFMVLSLYFLIYTRYNKREDANDTAMDVWKGMASEQKESAWNGFLNETIAQAKTGPIGTFVSYETTPPVAARLYMIT